MLSMESKSDVIHRVEVIFIHVLEVRFHPWIEDRENSCSLQPNLENTMCLKHFEHFLRIGKQNIRHIRCSGIISNFVKNMSHFFHKPKKSL